MQIKPWFHSSTRHLAVDTTVDGHWTLCPIISTHLQQNQIKPIFCSTSNNRISKNYEKPNCKKKPRSANLGFECN
jgi:hypothetical protein